MAILNPNAKASLFDFTNGIDVDQRLAQQEVQVQKAWANALVGARILTEAERTQLFKTLDEALALMEAGSFLWKKEDEDIHMNLERFLTERLGELGKKLHLGRSRNDLIATTLRLFTRDTLAVVSKNAAVFTSALLDLAEKEIDHFMPGMTHLQSGQPVRTAHPILGHAVAFARDVEKLSRASESALSSMPLGSAALAGTHLEHLNLEELCTDLGFKSPSLNSYDAVSDRDFFLDALHALASLAIHLSRLSEDLILWSSPQFQFVSLPPAWSTGSSIMPNKRNPDVPELVRAKSAHILAAYQNLSLLLKALPTSYASDLHEAKSIYLRALDETQKCLPPLTAFIQELKFNPSTMMAALEAGFPLATDLTNFLVTEKKLSFRDAYKEVARLVELARSQGKSFQDLGAAAGPYFDSTLLKEFTYEKSTELRKLPGGTSRAAIRDTLKILREKVSSFKLK